MSDIVDNKSKIARAKELGYSGFLLLEGGEIFFGNLLCGKRCSSGELCFTTSMIGYQHTVTDPSFAEQIIVFSIPHIGNVGINSLDNESSKILCKGVVVRENITESNHHLKTSGFINWLDESNVPAICGIDTRRLIKVIRTESQNAVIASLDDGLEHAKKILKSCSSMSNLELSRSATGLVYNEVYKEDSGRKTVALIDFGLKSGIAHCLSEYFNVKIISVSENFHEEVARLKPDCIALSNGPGDPYATFKLFERELNQILDTKLPILGICLGHQLLALLFGMKTKKMLVGHRGSNHPVHNMDRDKIEITTQNHGFVVDGDSISSEVSITCKSLFDDSIEGFKVGDKIFSYQYHPEGFAGPHDSRHIFESFHNAVKSQ